MYFTSGSDRAFEQLMQELMSQDETATMDGGKCILQVRGVRPFFSEKYDIGRHPRYKYLSDADKKDYFDVDGYLAALRRKRQRAVSQEEEPTTGGMELEGVPVTPEGNTGG